MTCTWELILGIRVAWSINVLQLGLQATLWKRTETFRFREGVHMYDYSLCCSIYKNA